MKWESFNDGEAQAFMSSVDGTYEGQALVPLHTGYLECAGVLPLCILPARIIPDFPIDMLCFYRAVYETFKLPAEAEMHACKVEQGSDVANLAAAIQFSSNVSLPLSRPILSSFINTITSGPTRPAGRFDLLFACKLLSETTCRSDVLADIKTGAIREHLIRTRGSVDEWVASWTDSTHDQ
jgi:hypothetical protein